MHPELFTIPGIGYSVRSYGFAVGLGFILALWIAVRRAPRASCEPSTITTLAILGMALGILGCRLMHVFHHYGEAILSGSMGVREVAAVWGGGEILGGVVLAILGVIGYLLIVRKPVLPYLDVTLPPMILAMGIGRIGCLLFGCCWGGVCTDEAGGKKLAWAIRFPYASPSYLRHAEEHLLEVPGELLWQPPKAPEPIPIPREVLAGYDIDNDPTLAAWAEKEAALNAARAADPPDPGVAGLEKEVDALRRELSKRKTSDLFNELAAARHLYRLNQRAGHTRVTWADLRRLAAGQHSRWVHPAQVYDAVALVLLFLVLSAIFERKPRPGTVLAWGMILYPVDRILQEMIRTDNPHDTFHLTISQFISGLVLVAGAALAVVLWSTRGRQRGSGLLISGSSRREGVGGRRNK